MLGNLNPYPDYKDSGIDWLGRIPAHWTFTSGRSVLREKAIKNTGLRESQVLSLSYGNIVIKPVERLHGLVPASFETYQIVDPGDIIIRPTDLQNDWNSVRVGHSSHRGIITSAYICIRVRNPLTPEYGYAYLNTCDMLKVFYGMGSGLRQNLAFSEIKRMPLLVPSEQEQSAIVRFLDHADRRIRRAIRAKRKLIALLNEQKQVIIRQTVTRGLDPNARLKPSGVEWLGDVPGHWEVWKIGHFAQVGNGSTPSRGNPGYWSNGTYPWLNSACVNQSPVITANQHVTEAALKECHLPRVGAGSVLVAITGQGKTRGTSAVLGMEATINQHMAYVSPKPSLVSCEYLQLALTAAYSELRRISEDAGSTKGALTCRDISDFKLALPSPEEQQRLIVYINESIHEADQAVKLTRTEIDLLLELRTRLVSDIVTGKLDVRDAAAQLSPEELTTESTDDTEAILEDEEILEDAETEEAEA